MNFNSSEENDNKQSTQTENDIDALVEPFDPDKPESVLFHFFLNMIKAECGESWKLFSRYTQQKILDTSYEEMKETEEFYLQDEITSKVDLKRAFEENASGLRGSFWLEFAVNTHADYMVEYAEYRTKSIKGNKALVEAVFKRLDGQETKLPFKLLYEDSCWRVAMIESIDED